MDKVKMPSIITQIASMKYQVGLLFYVDKTSSPYTIKKLSYQKGSGTSNMESLIGYPLDYEVELEESVIVESSHFIRINF